MAAVPQPRPASFNSAAHSARSSSPLHLIQGTLSSRKVARQFPMLAGLHRASDGALAGVLLTVALMSGLTLHLQHIWTVSFNKLEKTRTLSGRLTESTAMLESHLLKHTSLPQTMVPTKVANLLYLEHPDNQSTVNGFSKVPVLKELVEQPIHHGY